nr:PREDICTED: EKC/KEOPS complex subunit LAGE3 isoform X1 [Anolis carolinensis]|eukprot:XP_008120639.1 PREDICTED: EKC/KEOPS complex subunit LAGE3 isoform X1 [Anolis carolinensis]
MAAPGSALAFELSVPFPSSSLARIALGSLAPDPEPRKGGISKELSVTEDTLHVNRCSHPRRTCGSRIGLYSLRIHRQDIILGGPSYSDSEGLPK